MEKLPLPADFKDFLRLLNSAKVEYLLVGGYAVGHYGYPRTTGDLDIWVAATPSNANKVADVLRQFGFAADSVNAEMFSSPGQVVRMGIPPIRIDVITSASGVDFNQCFVRRNEVIIDGVETNMIHFEDLKSNKKASGRTKDINDLENLP
jgi:predicted nucleotidyltransferase